MGNTHRVMGYFASFACASLFYLLWFVVQTRTPDRDVTVLFEVGLALFFLIFEGAGAALVLLAFPWYLALIWLDRQRRYGLMYFSLTGAVMTLVIGCATSSLAPKPLFIEDQTFLEGCAIALQREGVCLSLTGFVFGLTFWYVSGKRQHSRSTKAATVQSDSPLE